MSTTNTGHTTTIQKRDGRIEPFDARKPESHLQLLSWGLSNTSINIPQVVVALTSRLPSATMNSETFLVFLADVVASFSSRHPDYSILAGRVYACYHHKRVPKRFSTWILSFENSNPPVFTPTVLEVVRRHATRLDAAVLHSRDFDYTYRALQSFERWYLLRDGRELNERLQFLFMRVSLAIHGDSIDDVVDTYNLLSLQKIAFGSRTLSNGGLACRHYSSSYTYEPRGTCWADAISNFADISRLWAASGEVGINASRIPATRSHSTAHPGLLPLLRVYDSLAHYWSRSVRLRAPMAAVYLPIWHSDVRKFVMIQTSRASSASRFRYLYPVLWVPNIFMRRLQLGESWSLFNPLHANALTDLYDTAFDTTYTEYERNGLASDHLPARVLWDLVADAIRDSCFPLIMFSDNVNARNNQMHVGLIKASNVSGDLTQVSTTIDTAVSPTVSICLPRFIRSDGTLDYDDLHRVAKVAVRSLDRIIDVTNYPTADAAVSAYRTRSIALGTQGLADVFSTLEIPFTSARARALNKRIFETIYHASLESSSELAESTEPYDAWVGSPAQQGLLQVDMWQADTSDHYNFDALRDRIRRTGLRNSVITSQISTTSTAYLFGNSDGVDPYPSNLVEFQILGGDATEIVRPLVSALQKRGIWSEDLRNDILASHGSIQSLSGIPADLKLVFLTAYELNQHDVISFAADRAPFIDQSQALSVFVSSISSTSLMDLHLHAWRLGLKTGPTYNRCNLPTEPFTYAPTNPSSIFSIPPPVRPVSSVSSVNATSVSLTRDGQ